MFQFFKTTKIEKTPVYIDGVKVNTEEYPVIDINPNMAVIRDPEKPEPEDYYIAATTHPERYYDAKIEYNIDKDLRYSSIWKISVYDPLKRGQHQGRALICHVLRQLKDNQQIWLRPSADPMPMDMNTEHGPVYGLRQKELEQYYKRFSFGKYHRQILFEEEMEQLCNKKNKNK